jgi:PAS domain S-box-containing protein
VPNGRAGNVFRDSMLHEAPVERAPGGMPLFYRLLAALIIVGLIPTVPLFFLLFRYNAEVALQRTGNDLSQQVTLLATSFDQEHRTATQRSLKQIATSEALAALLSGPLEERLVNAKSLEALFQNIAREHAVYSGLYFIDADGHEVASVVDQQRSGRFGEKRSWTALDADKPSPTVTAGQALLKRLFTTPSLLAAGNMEWFMPPRDMLAQGPFVDERGRPSLLLGLSTVDIDSGALSGAALIRVDLSAFLAVLRTVKVLDANVAWLLDAANKPLLRPEGNAGRLDPATALPADLALEVRLVRDSDGLIAYRDIGTAGNQRLLRLAYAVPDDLVAQEFEATRNLFAIALVVSLLASLALAYAVSKTIARPIVSLAGAARKLSQGDLSARVDVKAGGEVQVLVDSFNSMAGNLGQSLQDLSAQTLVIDKAPFGIMILDPQPEQHRVHYANEAFSRLLGFSEAQVRGRHPRMLLAGDAGAAKAELIERAFAELTSVEVEVSTQPREGPPRLMNWLVFPCISSDGEVISIVVFLNDLTDIRAMEQERERLAAELQESNKLEFLALTIAGISHDLNTPIGVGVTAASQLQRTVERMRAVIDQEPGNIEGLKNWCKKVEQTTEIISRNLEKAGQLVQGFKKTSANATRTEWVTLNVRSLLESLLVSLSPIMRRAHCTVHLSCPPVLQLFTEPGSVSQAVTNLLINATVHAFENRDDRQIEVTVSDSAEEVLIKVADNGNGMTEEAAVKAFTPFFTTKRASGGSGLGLFSSRRVVEEVLGGRLSFETTPGQGTCFFIHLPKTRATALKDPL